MDPWTSVCMYACMHVCMYVTMDPGRDILDVSCPGSGTGPARWSAPGRFDLASCRASTRLDGSFLGKP